MARVVYKSNGGAIGDGLRVTRISEGGQKLEVLVDEKLERYSEVILKADDPVEPEPEPPVDPEPEPEPPVSGDLIQSAAQLSAALADTAGGFALRLAGADFGGLSLSGRQYASPVRIEAADPANPPRFTARSVIDNCSNITFDGMLFDYTFGGEARHVAHVYVSDSARVGFTNCAFDGDDSRGTGDPVNDGFPWARAIHFKDCADIVFTYNKVHNWMDGVHVHGTVGADLTGTEIWHIRNDATHGTFTDGLLYDGVHIHDMRRSWQSGDHSDMAQLRENHKNLTIRNSRFDIGDGDSSQLLWMGGGNFENLVIENNDIIGNHSHGISVGTARGLRVVNNRLRYKFGGLDESWANPNINLDGASTNVVVTDNQAYKFNPNPPPSSWVYERNTVLTR